MLHFLDLFVAEFQFSLMFSFFVVYARVFFNSYSLYLGNEVLPKMPYSVSGRSCDVAF